MNLTGEQPGSNRVIINDVGQRLLLFGVCDLLDVAESKLKRIFAEGNLPESEIREVVQNTVALISLAKRHTEIVKESLLTNK